MWRDENFIEYDVTGCDPLVVVVVVFVVIVGHKSYQMMILFTMRRSRRCWVMECAQWNKYKLD